MTDSQPLDGDFAQAVLDAAPDGVAICDARLPDYPVTYVNQAFEQLTGYPAAELLGANLRLLQGSDNEQEGLRRLREAQVRGEPCRVLLRHYRKSGELFWNEMALQPVRDAAGQLLHYIAYCRDAALRLRQADRVIEGMPAWLREDRVTGLLSSAWFVELLKREWGIARRDGQPVTLALFDIDAMALYNTTYGKSGGDAVLRRIGRSIADAFRRASDVVGIWRPGCIGVLAVQRDGKSVDGLVEHAQGCVRRIADLRIHHPRAPLSKFITLTASLATVTPQRDDEEPARLIDRAELALQEAKRELRGGLNHAPD